MASPLDLSDDDREAGIRRVQALYDGVCECALCFILRRLDAARDETKHAAADELAELGDELDAARGRLQEAADHLARVRAAAAYLGPLGSTVLLAIDGDLAVQSGPTLDDYWPDNALPEPAGG